MAAPKHRPRYVAIRSRKYRTSRYAGQTRAYGNLRDHIRRTEELLGAGLTGLEGSVEKTDSVRRKLEGVKELGRARPLDKPMVAVRRKDDGEPVGITVDAYSGRLMLEAVEAYVAWQKRLRFHLYSILLAASWGAFETYITSALDELYSRRPELLISNDTLTVRDVMDNRTDILAYLTQRQLEKIGHMKIRDILEYLNSKTGFNLSEPTRKRLYEIYQLRNIIAHNSGVVRRKLSEQLPRQVKQVKGELRITKAYLCDIITFLLRVAERLERHFVNKYYRAA